MADRSGRVAFRRAVLKGRSGECRCLPDVFRLQIRIVPEKVVPIWVGRHCFHDPAYRQPHTTDARLTVHLVRVPRYPIKELHRFHFDTFWHPALLGGRITPHKRARHGVRDCRGRVDDGGDGGLAGAVAASGADQAGGGAASGVMAKASALEIRSEFERQRSA